MRARTLVDVFKVRIGVSITLCAMAGIAATPGGVLSPWQVAALALCVLLSSASAGAFNQYAERGLDRLMARTRKRAFATGELAAGWQWPTLIGILLAIAVAGAALATNLAAAAYVFLGAFVYGVVYTLWLKRRTALNIVVGGLAGSFAVLAGSAAVSPTLSPEALILAAVLFLWTPPHFWSLAFAFRREYAAAGVPMLPCVVGKTQAVRVIAIHAVALALLSLAPGLFGAGAAYLACAAGGGLLFVAASLRLLRAPTTENAMKNFRASLVQLCALLVGTLLDAWVT
jgi:protoheme IX farnesyltransferase